MTDYTQIRYEQDGRVARLALNRPRSDWSTWYVWRGKSGRGAATARSGYGWAYTSISAAPVFPPLDFSTSKRNVRAVAETGK